MHLNKLLTAALVFALAGAAHAGLSGDHWSVGETPSNSSGSLRVNQYGHTVPGQNRTYDLGEPSSATFRNVYSASAVFQNLETSTLTLNASAAQLVSSMTRIEPSSSYIVVNTTAGDITMARQPAISTGAAIQDGQLLVVTSTGTGLVILQDDDTLAGSSLELGAASRSIGVSDVLTLIYDGLARKWRELAFSSND